jgi:peroxiredoxin (alkyl hydroperoxide reductase subunit C)
MGGIPFPIAADFHPKAAVAQAYGVYNAERGTAFRSVFLIDENGVVRRSQVYQPGTLPDPIEIHAAMKSLT